MTNLIKKVETTVKHWYMPLFVGLLFIALGVWTLFSPTDSYVGLSVLFTVTFIIGGIIDIFFAVANKDELDHWGWELVNGILGLVIGIIMAANPAISMITLPFYIGFVVMFRSVLAISSSIEIKKYRVLDWKNLMAMGILGLIFSFILLWNPLFAGLTIVVWTGIALVTIGSYGVYFSFKLKKLHTYGKDIKENIQ